MSDPHSDSYKNWVVITRDRVVEIGAAGRWEGGRRLNVAPNQFVNGVLVTNLADNKFIYAESDVRSGNQVQFLFSPDFDLTGKTNIYISYNSIYEQNQDSIGAVEYSIDGGTTWLPIVYMIDAADILRDPAGNVDAVATLNEPRNDTAVYFDPVTGEQKGGTYGAFIGAPISADLSAFISPRVNDDATESKRVEYFRLDKADKQARVRFRFAQAGTASWYFGLDNFGIYSVAPAAARPARPTVVAPQTVSFLSSDLTVTSSAFVPGKTGDTHALSTWQFSGSSAFTPENGFANVLATVTSPSDLTALTIALNLAPGKTYYATVRYQDQNAAASDFAEPASFGVEALPAPIVFENFEAAPDYGVPNGWVVTNQTDGASGVLDPADPNSDTYLDWVVVPIEQLTTFGGSRADMSVVSGKSIYAESDNRSGNQIQFLYTPNFNLSGKSNVWLVFKSNYMQNQDSLGGLEYSTDNGGTWLPIIYMIDRDDIIRAPDGAIDAAATLTTTYGDVAKIIDPNTGDRVEAGKYADFIQAGPVESLGPYVSGRINDNALESKRVEKFRLDDADNKPQVQFRFVQAGTGSWYWGIDDFGLYSAVDQIPATAPKIVEQPVSQIGIRFSSVTFKVVATGAAPLQYQWLFNGVPRPGATDSTLVLNPVRYGDAGAYSVIVSNSLGAVTSDTVQLIVNPGPPLFVTGQWDFENGDLKATVGTDLAYRGDTAAGTTFSTMTIAGEPAKVMQFPATTPAQGYIMTHGAAPNGGGTNVNQYTLIMDVMFPTATSGRFRALLQTDPNNNDNDADLFVNGANGIGISGSYQGEVRPDTWHRLAFVFDLPAKTLRKYVDGALVNVQTLSATAGGVDQRWSLLPTALLFADEDSETASGFVNSIQFRNGRSSDAEIAALGGASAGGIPLRDVTGQWDFENRNLLATVGHELHDQGGIEAASTYVDVSIGGQSAVALSFPAAKPGQGFILPHGAAPNGGGTNVNQYTLIMDILFPSASSGKYRALLQTDPNDANDGDLFVNPANGIGISGSYQGQIMPDTWHRVAFAFDLTTKTLGKYIDGALVNLQTLSATSGGVDQRWSLLPTALLFADEDNETAGGLVNSIQFRNRRLTDAEIAALGGPTGAGITIMIPKPAVSLRITSITKAGNAVTITWPAHPDVVLQKTSSLTNPNWQTVQGSAGTASATETISGTAFYRLAKP